MKELLGHKSLKMTMRYAHHYPESLRRGVDVLNRFGEEQVTDGDILVTVDSNKEKQAIASYDNCLILLEKLK